MTIGGVKNFGDGGFMRCLIYNFSCCMIISHIWGFRTTDLKNYILIEQQVDDTVRGNEKVNPLGIDHKRNTF